MSIVPCMKKCPWCGQMFDYNPDVGHFVCQKCLLEARTVADAPAKTLKEKMKKAQAKKWLAKEE